MKLASKKNSFLRRFILKINAPPAGNENFHPLLLVGTSLLLLLIISILPCEFHWRFLHLKKIDLLRSLRPTPLNQDNASAASTLPPPGHPMEPYGEDNLSRLQEAWLGPGLGPPPRGIHPPLRALLSAARPGKAPSFPWLSSRLWHPANSSALTFSPLGQPIEEYGENNLSHLWEALRALGKEGKKVRIAYYGDSLIEGDMVTQELRENLQKIFGGSGTGYLPITSTVAAFRISVKHTFSSGWHEFSFLTKVPKDHPLGIAGLLFESDPSSPWVQYKVPGYRKDHAPIYTLRIYYSHARSPATLKYAFDGGAEQREELHLGTDINQAILISPLPAREVKVTFESASPLFIYGASWESEEGVILDNFSLRGNSGLPLSGIPCGTLKEFNRLMDFKLIILHYGLNVISPEDTDYSWYEKRMEKVIAYLKNCFPEASFLLISVPDRSYKADEGFATIPAIPFLVECQKRIAKKTEIAFWNLYQAMGGTNSMIGWVKHTPPWAALDYTHLSHYGSRKMADMLAGAIMAKFRENETQIQ
jgi:hypothetical protein